MTAKKVGTKHAQLNLQEASAAKDVLTKISFELTPSELLIVIGACGSGKTSLLHALMGETNQTGGQHSVRGKLAYVEQEPFIFSASVRDNVCFGLDYDEERFD